MGRLPPEHGWHSFRVRGRTASWEGPAEPEDAILRHRERGYLVGDRMVRDGSSPDPDPARIALSSEPVHAIPDGLSRFVRVSAGRIREDSPLVFSSEEMPEGPEDEVLAAYQDRASSVAGIKGVTPALDAAFRMETWRRAEADRARAEIERARLEAAARAAEEERREAFSRTLASGQGRRQAAVVDFEAAARAALAVGRAEYLDHRASARKGEMVVTYRVDARRLQCVCDAQTLRIVDAGVCLTSHRTGERGDERFTLESLPSVIREAVDGGVLVILRRVDPEPGEDWDEYTD